MSRKLVFAVTATLLGVALFVTTPPAYAGILSLAEDFFGPTTKAAKAAEATPSLNSQNVGLQANTSSNNGKLPSGGSETTIVGGSALLADAGPVGTLADIKDLPTAEEISIYVVRSGDSLSDIAEMFGVSVNTIIWANDLSRGSVIKEGQTLLILPVSGVRHIVQTGETIQSIAKKYKGDANEIIQFNGLDAKGTLAKGDELIIPNGEEVAVTVVAPKKKVSGTARGGGPSYVGYYLRPVAGAIKTQGLHGYNGIDLGAPTGSPIMAAAAGRVLVSRSGSWNGGYGNYIVIEHPNGTQTLYAHNSQNIVAAGQSVVQGQVIGYVGSTGHSTGPHVHFEIRGAKNPF